MSHASHHQQPGPDVPVRIDVDAFYTDPQLRLLTGLSGATLARARRSGELRHSRRGRVIWHRGNWIVEWLCGDTLPAARSAEGRLAHVG